MRFPLSFVPSVSVTVIFTTTRPFGSPRRSIGAVRRLPFTTATRFPLKKTVAAFGNSLDALLEEKKLPQGN